jgi:hypothetical protein
VDILPTKVTSGGASAAVSACASTSGARVHVAGGGGLGGDFDVCNAHISLTSSI